MSCDIYMALSCMGSILKIHGVSCDSTVGEMPLPLKASHLLAAVCDIGSQCGPQCPLKRQLIKAWAQTTLPGLSPTTPSSAPATATPLPNSAAARACGKAERRGRATIRAPNGISGPLKIGPQLPKPLTHLHLPTASPSIHPQPNPPSPIRQLHPSSVLSINVIKGGTKSFLSPSL